MNEVAVHCTLIWYGHRHVILLRLREHVTQDGRRRVANERAVHSPLVDDVMTLENLVRICSRKSAQNHWQCIHKNQSRLEVFISDHYIVHEGLLYAQYNRQTRLLKTAKLRTCSKYLHKNNLFFFGTRFCLKNSLTGHRCQWAQTTATTKTTLGPINDDRIHVRAPRSK